MVSDFWAIITTEILSMSDTNANLIEHISRGNFVDTLDHLTRSIEEAGMRIFCRIDHAAAAAEAGLSMPPTTVLIYGNPKAGTAVMVAVPSAALDLPLHVLVREDAAGHVVVSFHPIAFALARLGVAEVLSRRLEQAQRLLIEAVAKTM